MSIGFIVAGLVILSILSSSFKILQEYERGIVFRLGRSVGVRGPGLIILVPFLEKMMKVDMRTVTMDVQPQDVITKDNVSMKVNAIVYFRIVNAEAAIIQVADYYYATSQLAQTTLRSILGQFPLDEILTNRDSINSKLQALLDQDTEGWGVKVSAVEVKNIDLPKEMQRAMAQEAETERERRSKIISAEGEVQRASRLAEASNTLASSPSALQLAYLQTMNEITSEGKTVIVFPLPLDLLKPFLEGSKK
jgi:regulator of protease activity HflC (stomatin/prohibitin superfamily)